MRAAGRPTSGRARAQTIMAPTGLMRSWAAGGLRGAGDGGDMDEATLAALYGVGGCSAACDNSAQACVYGRW